MKEPFILGVRHEQSIPLYCGTFVSQFSVDGGLRELTKGLSKIHIM